MVIDVGSVVKLSRPCMYDVKYKDVVGVVIALGAVTCIIRIEDPHRLPEHIQIGVYTHRLDEL